MAKIHTSALTDNQSQGELFEFIITSNILTPQ